ncbi:hypothetical protein BH09PAT2_BH09PAT2_04410 [soil metagenome]
MKKTIPNAALTTSANSSQNSNTDDIDFIDPVAPKDQVEQQDRYFNQMGDDRNAKFVEQKNDDDEPLGSVDGEYPNDDENATIHPPKEEILHEHSKNDK